MPLILCSLIFIALQCLVTVPALAEHYSEITLGAQHILISSEAHEVYSNSYALRSTVNYVIRNGKCDPSISADDTAVSEYYFACIVQNSPYHVLIFSKKNDNQVVVTTEKIDAPFYQIELLDEQLLKQIQERTFVQYNVSGERRIHSLRQHSQPKTFRRWVRYKMVATRDLLDKEAFFARVSQRQAEWNALLLQLDTAASGE